MKRTLFPATLLLVLLFAAGRPPGHLPTDLEISVWAQHPMLKNPVALSHDPAGRLYVTETNRRRSEDLDVRFMRDLSPIPWPVLDLTLEAVDDRRALVTTYLAPNSPHHNPWLPDRNSDGSSDWRDLTTLSERVNLLEDTDGDGVADRATVFADSFQTEVTGVAGGVLWFDDKVYLSVIPDLWQLEDTDGDGIADRRTVLQGGHGVHIGQGGHDLHGLTVGPDGRIYWSIGDKGVNFVTKEGRHIYYPNQGLVLRSEPDGRNVEVFAHGLRNCQELSFDALGHLFCMDNDGDFEGERERFVYVTEGSDSGWRINWQYNLVDTWAREQGLPAYHPWMDERLFVPRFDGQAAYITPPLANYSNGPAGFLFNPGTALNEAYRDYVFITQFPGRQISAFQIRPRGAGFEMVNAHTFHEGFMATGLSFGPDGALYAADWSGDWAPNQEGAIVRLDFPGEAASARRVETRRLIAEGMSRRSDDALVNLLAHDDQRVRLDAQFELARRNRDSRLLETAFDSDAPTLARVHAIWGMGQLARRNALRTDRPLAPLLQDPDVEIRRQALRFAGDHPSRFSNLDAALRQRLADSDPETVFHAAMALGKAGSAAAVPDLLALLARYDDQDAFIRHAAISGLAGIGDAEALAGASTHPSTAVRRGAVVALRRLAHPAVARFLDDADVSVAREAARAIHDDSSIPAALPALAAQVATSPHRDEAFMRRALNANLRSGRPQDAARLMDYALNAAQPVALREEALGILASWSAPPFLDRVERRHRPLPARPPAVVASLVERHAATLFASASPTVLEASLKLVRTYDVAIAPDLLLAWLADASKPLPVRVEVLRLMEGRPGLLHGIASAFRSGEPALRIEALRIEARQDPARASARIRDLLRTSDVLSERQAAFALLRDTPLPERADILMEWTGKLINNNVLEEEKLDIYLAARSAGDAMVDEALAGIGLERPGAQAPDRFTLYGGDAERGRALFARHPSAQCARCHNVEDPAPNVGPALAGIGARADRAYLLEALVAPGATIARGFQTVVLTLDDGETVSGTLANAGDDTLRLRLANGSIREIAASRVQRQVASMASMMPPMGDVLSPAELRDIVAYLAALRKRGRRPR